jgi:hypothetical protein
MMRLAIVLSACVCVFAALPATAQDRYLMLAATRTSTMQAEINQAASQGYRVVAASRTETAEVIVVLEKGAAGYDYRLIATTRTGTLQKEISAAAAAGYRIVPRAVTTKRSVGGLFANSSDEGELLVVMEKGPDTPQGLAYVVVATSRTGTMQQEMSETAGKGLQLIAVASRGEHVAVFERAPK